MKSGVANPCSLLSMIVLKAEEGWHTMYVEQMSKMLLNETLKALYAYDYMRTRNYIHSIVMIFMDGPV